MNTWRIVYVDCDWLHYISRDTDVMRCICRRNDVTEAVLVFAVTMATWLMGGTLEVTLAEDYSLETQTVSQLPSTLQPLTTQRPPEEEVCCKGVLGYASDNMSLNFPCQNRPCCNSSDTVAVVSIDYALGFRFQCMPRRSIQPLCYAVGAEVRTSNQDPDFIPRTCCQGLKFKVVVNQWYSAMVVKCVEQQEQNGRS